MSASDEILSDPGDTLDALVSQASKPTLASLFKKAKAKGLITPITHYGPNKETPEFNPGTPPASGQGAPNVTVGGNFNTGILAVKAAMTPGSDAPF